MKKFKQQFSNFSKKEKFIYIVECILSVIALFFLVFGIVKDSDVFSNRFDYLLYVIFILNGIRKFDDDELWSIISIVVGIIGFIVKTFIIVF